MKLKPKDLKIETFRIKNDVREGSAGIRITHIPTGIQVVRTESKLYHINRDAALKKLEEKLEKK